MLAASAIFGRQPASRPLVISLSRFLYPLLLIAPPVSVLAVRIPTSRAASSGESLWVALAPELAQNPWRRGRGPRSSLSSLLRGPIPPSGGAPASPPGIGESQASSWLVGPKGRSQGSPSAEAHACATRCPSQAFAPALATTRWGSLAQLAVGPPGEGASPRLVLAILLDFSAAGSACRPP